VLIPPIVAAVRLRGAGLAILSGAYVAFMLHLAGDWDWQVPGVAAAGLLVGVSLPIDARARFTTTLGMSQRAALGGAFCVAVLLSTVGLIGNLELHRAQQALDRGDWASAISYADSASNWMPWSYDPDVVRGDGEIGL